MDSDNLEERVLRRIPLETLALSFVLALGLLAAFGPLVAALFFAGGALTAAGFLGLKQAVDRFVSVPKKKALVSGILLYGLRLLLICAVFFIIILFFSKKIIAFAAGFSTVIPVFMAEALAALLRDKKWKN